MKLVDTLAEQALLEDALEASKPPLPADCQQLHYLLATPFRYGAPYPRGSRFRRAGHTAGVFYASRTPATAIAEMAFHRLVFFADSPATPWPHNAGEVTVFAIEIRSRAAIDLTRPPLDRARRQWTSPTDYEACQALADAAREGGIEAILYESVRDPARGLDVAVLACRAFSGRAPSERQTWRMHLSASGVRADCAHPDTRLEFGRQAFANDPRIAAFEWNRPARG